MLSTDHRLVIWPGIGVLILGTIYLLVVLYRKYRRAVAEAEARAAAAEAEREERAANYVNPWIKIHADYVAEKASVLPA